MTKNLEDLLKTSTHVDQNSADLRSSAVVLLGKKKLTFSLVSFNMLVRLSTKRSNYVTATDWATKLKKIETCKTKQNSIKLKSI